MPKCAHVAARSLRTKRSPCRQFRRSSLTMFSRPHLQLPPRPLYRPAGHHLLQQELHLQCPPPFLPNRVSPPGLIVRLRRKPKSDSRPEVTRDVRGRMPLRTLPTHKDIGLLVPHHPIILSGPTASTSLTALRRKKSCPAGAGYGPRTASTPWSIGLPWRIGIATPSDTSNDTGGRIIGCSGSAILEHEKGRVN